MSHHPALDGQLLLAQLRDVLEHRFYEEQATGKLVYLRPEVDREDLARYMGKIDDICLDLDQLFQRLRGKPSGSGPLPGPVPTPVSEAAGSPFTVYLAQTSKDLEAERQQIRSELKQFNYRVLPEHPLPQDAEQFSAAVQQDLEQSQLALHRSALFRMCNTTSPPRASKLGNWRNWFD